MTQNTSRRKPLSPSGKTLVLGSTVADVIVKVPRLPATAQDVNIISQHHRLGGCAHNVAHVLRLARSPHVLCSPVGCGIYGEFVERSLLERGIPVFARLPDVANGCCYCLVEPSGERTFLSHHGAEYLFRREWFTESVLDGADAIYICGLELEEESSPALVAFLEESLTGPLRQLFFAPGPRINSISSNLMERILNLSPILHLNEEEATSFTRRPTAEEALRELHRRTGTDAVITRGKAGAVCIHQGTMHSLPGHKANVVDTIGAGDAHIGSIIAGLRQGRELPQAVERANAVSAVVVSVEGATLTAEEYEAAIKA